MSFEVVTDRNGKTFRPAIHQDALGPSRLVFLYFHRWGGMTPSGIVIDYEMEELPATLGVLYAIRDDSPLNIVNTPRDEGGLMPGDLFVFPRYAAWKISELDLEIEAQGSDLDKITVPLYVMAESEIECRVDGVLPDPYEAAVHSLEVPALAEHFSGRS